MKCLETELDENYTRLLYGAVNKSWKQHPTEQQLYGHIPPITQTIQLRRARQLGNAVEVRTKLINDILLWTPTHGHTSVGHLAKTYIRQLCMDTGCCLEDLPRPTWKDGKRVKGLYDYNIFLNNFPHIIDGKNFSLFLLDIYHCCIVAHTIWLLVSQKYKRCHVS